MVYMATRSTSVRRKMAPAPVQQPEHAPIRRWPLAVGLIGAVVVSIALWTGILLAGKSVLAFFGG